MNEPTATIYDLGYKRYLGTRRSQSTRWQVIARQQIAYAWAKWWRLKLYVAFAVLVTVVFGALLVVAHSDALGSLKHNGMLMKRMDQLVFTAYIVIPFIAFFLGLTIGCRIVAADLRTGAFAFYFVRPVRPIDYVVGKMVGLTLLTSFVVLAPMLVLAITRVALSENASELVDNLPNIPKALLIGGLASFAYAGIALAFSSLFAKPWINRLMWAAYFLLVLHIITALIMNVLKVREIATIDPGFAIVSLVFSLFGIDVDGGSGAPVSALWAILGLAFNGLGGAAIVYARVRSVSTAGIGGGS